MTHSLPPTLGAADLNEERLKGKILQVLGGQHAKCCLFSDSVNLKSFPIEREDIPDARVLGKSYEGCIGKVHGQVLILCHETLAAPKGCPGHRNEGRTTPNEEFETVQLAARHACQKVQCLRQDRLSGEQDTSKSLENLRASLVVSIVTGEDRNQRPRVQ